MGIRAKTEMQRQGAKLAHAVRVELCADPSPKSSTAYEAAQNAAILAGPWNAEDVERILAGRSVAEHIGAGWVAAHPCLLAAIREYESALARERQSS